MLGDMMNHAPEPRQDGSGIAPPLIGRIEFRDVNFAYDPVSPAALRGVSFSINPGEIVGVVGPSGSGKSTITKLIQALYLPTTGTIALDGVDLRELNVPSLRRRLGVVLQENFLFRGTIAENIRMSKREASPEEIMRAAVIAGAAEFIQRLPAGLDTKLEENGANLSGGQKQRLAIARAVLRDPRILIFDEATSALDVESEAVIQENLSTIAKGRTLVMVAHRLSTLRDAHRIMVIKDGQVEAFAPHATLIGSSQTYRDLWEQQATNLGPRATLAIAQARV
jgi:ATP-binding cassette subfamily B protein